MREGGRGVRREGGRSEGGRSVRREVGRREGGRGVRMGGHLSTGTLSQ